MGIKHSFQSTKPQGGDPNLVSKNEWNADHSFVESGGQNLGIGSILDNQFLQRVGQNIVGATTPKVKILTISRDLSLASGDVSYTGVGFTPKVGIFIAAITAAGSQDCCWGFGNSTTSSCVQYDLKSSAQPRWLVLSKILSVKNNDADYVDCTFVSSDADGFTLNWSKVGAPTGTCTVLCLLIG